MTLKELERRIKALRKMHPEPPTFEEFQELWEHMDELSKAVLEGYAGLPEILDSLGEYEKIVIGHMKRMGLVKPQDTLAEIMEKID